MPVLSDLFLGFEKAHGLFEVKRTNDKGKAEGRAVTVTGPVTDKLWEQHIKGTGPGLGIIPLTADNMVHWACIDIDIVTIDHTALEKKINQFGLPLVVARSKSGGAHCFVFFSEETPAKEVRTALETWAALLGYGGCEVFPKQTQRYDLERDLGNWLNMPYFYAEKTNRYGIKDGQKLSLDEFVDYAYGKRITADDLRNVAIGSENNEGDFEDGPPCLQRLQAIGGFPQGTRNEGVYNVLVYLRKKYPDNWQDHAQKYNMLMCDPALGLSELNTLVKSVGRKNYGYRCKQAPIAPHCQRSLCLTRSCGVGETVDAGNMPEIGQLTKYEGDPPLWFLEVNGKRIMMTTDEILNQSQFRKRLVDGANVTPLPVANPRFIKWISEKIQHAEVIDVPQEASPTGQFRILVQQYTHGQAQATSKEELIHRTTPFRTGTGEVWFRSRGLLDYLAHHGFKIKSEHHVWQMLREMDGKSQFVNIKGHGFNVWVLPETKTTEEDAPLPTFGTKEF